MSLREVGLLVYSQGFAISRDETIIRELAFCDWTGHHHALFKYLLLRACRTINYPRRPRLASIVRPGRCMACRLNRTRLTTAMHSIPTIRSRTISPAGVNSISPPQQGRLGVFTLNGLYRWLHEPGFSYPIVVLEGQGCRDLPHLPIATVNVMATNDQGRNWCMDHTDGERGRGIWHDHCAHVRACQMSGWLRRQTNVLPTLFQVNAQRVLWQRRCDRLMDYLLCNYCKEEKDEAFTRGQGLDWIPDNYNECSTVRRIFEQTVICRE